MITGTTIRKKPKWLNKKIDFFKSQKMNEFLKKLELNTICREAKCPNISECFHAGVASFLIMGDVCTRRCMFCGVKKGKPLPIDKSENKRLAHAVKLLNLKHVVITSVTRDDLPDGGSQIFADAVKEIRLINKDVIIEILVPDFKGNKDALENVIESKPDVFAHNLETIPRLYDSVRRDSNYKLSLQVLHLAKTINKNIYTKSGIMLGLGEKREEVLNLLEDLKRVHCDFVTIGQYLGPTLKHFSVKEFVRPEVFEFYKEKCKEFGFLNVESAPYVRSSYLASKYFEKK
jgi:lipoyl synthase